MEKIVNYGVEDIERILIDVKQCKQFFITKNGQLYSLEAENFLEWINGYTKYCLPEMVESWKQNVRNLIYSPIVLKPRLECTQELQTLVDDRDFYIIDSLFNYMDAGKIMQVFAETGSWDEVENAIRKQGHSGYTFSGISNVMLQYSPHGVDFINRFDPDRPNRDKIFKKIYNKKKICC